MVPLFHLSIISSATAKPMLVTCFILISFKYLSTLNVSYIKKLMSKNFALSNCQRPNDFRCGSRIWSRGGPQLLRPKVADIAKRSRASEVSILRLGSRARLRALEAFGFLMLKYAFSHILETLFLLFLTSILTPKVDKNRALDFTSINLRHSDMLHLFF